MCYLYAHSNDRIFEGMTGYNRFNTSRIPENIAIISCKLMLKICNHVHSICIINVINYTYVSL